MTDRVANQSGVGFVLPLTDNLPRNSERQLFCLKVTIVVGMLVGLLLSFKLWSAYRSYPMSPVFETLQIVPNSFDSCAYVLCLVLLVLIAAHPRPGPLILLFLSLCACLVLRDQSRLQPWFYQYLFMIAAFGPFFGRDAGFKRRTASLNACRLLIVSIYFWSGVHKANTRFVNGVFPWLVEPLTRFSPKWLESTVLHCGFAVPLLEVAISLALVSRTFRHAGVAAAFVMHAFILAAIGPFGHNINSVVWFWNLTMPTFVVVLFWRSSEFSPKGMLWPKATVLQGVVLTFCTLAPVLSVFNLWDNYLSWALYAGNKNVGVINISDSVYKRLPDGLQEIVTEDTAHVNEIAIDEWSSSALNVPPYPEVRVYKMVARSLCLYASIPSDVVLIIHTREALFNPSKQSRYDCRTLVN